MDASGTVQERYAYAGYGRTSIYTPTFADRTTSSFNWEFRYTGRRQDLETGVYFFRARYYHAQLGRFISRDPIGYVDGMSLYRGYFVPDAMDPKGTDRWVGNDGKGNKIFWSGEFCYIKTQIPWIRVDCPGDQGGDTGGNGPVVAGASSVCVFITADTCFPDPSDVLPPKWVCYAVGGAIAGTIVYMCCKEVVNHICTFEDCDGGSKPCGDIGIRRCQWAETLGGMNICGCFP